MQRLLSWANRHGFALFCVLWLATWAAGISILVLLVPDNFWKIITGFVTFVIWYFFEVMFLYYRWAEAQETREREEQRSSEFIAWAEERNDPYYWDHVGTWEVICERTGFRGDNALRISCSDEQDARAKLIDLVQKDEVGDIDWAAIHYSGKPVPDSLYTNAELDSRHEYTYPSWWPETAREKE